MEAFVTHNSPLEELIVGWQTLTSLGLFTLSVISVVATTSYTSSLPVPNKEFLSHHKQPIKKDFPNIDRGNGEYKTKMTVQCQEMLKQLRQA